MSWAAAIGAGASILGGMMGRDSQEEANRMNIQLQREQRAWEEKMSNTAIRRRKEDLLAAGFNPLLAVGSEATTPNVASARVMPEDALARGVAQSAVVSAQVANLHTASAKNMADAEKARADAGLAQAQTGVIPETINHIRATIANLDADTSKKGVEEAGVILENGIRELNAQQLTQLMPYIIAERKALAEAHGIDAKVKAMRLEVLDTWIGRASLYAERILPTAKAVGSAAGAMSLFRGLRAGPLKLPFGKRTGFFDKDTGEIFK